VKITLFTADEANRVVGEIRVALEQLVRTKKEYDRLTARMDALSLATAGASAANPDARELKELEVKRNTVAELLRRGIQPIQSRGVVIKDLDRGLIDFYSLMGDRLIFLCWHLGESEVSYWHTIEGGYAGRQPLHRSERE
jgi:hypothetical protein